MSDFYGMVREWHETFGAAVRDELSLDVPENALRVSLLEEEYTELMDGIAAGDIENVAKEMADLIYVICGAALTWGIPLPAVFKEVQRSNMSKLGEDGKPVLRADGKILKGENYSEADLGPILWPPVA